MTIKNNEGIVKIYFLFPQRMFNFVQDKRLCYKFNILRSLIMMM